MSDEIASFPLPYDVTNVERSQARERIGTHAQIVGEEAGEIRFTGRALGQTGPIWHFQYLRIYQLPKGYIIAGRDLREGVKVGYADSAEGLAHCFDHEGVNEFIADELRFRGVIGSEHAATG